MTAPAATSGERLHRLVFFSLLTGLTPLIPFPFVDDWARDYLRRRLASDLLRGRPMGEDELKVLACGESPGGSFRGCFLATVWRAIVVVGKKLLRKVFRTILFFLAVRDCARTFARTFHEGYFLRHAISLGELDGSPPDGTPPDGTPAPAARVREAIEASVERIDLRRVEGLARRTLRGSWKTLRTSARRLGRWLRGLRRGGEEGEGELEVQEEVLRPLVDDLTEGLRHESGYLPHLEALFEAELDRLGRASALPPPPSAAELPPG